MAIERSSAGTGERLRHPNAPRAWLDRLISNQPIWDQPAEAVQRVIAAAYAAMGTGGRLVKDTLHGTHLLGHPLHPAATDIPLGAWTVGVIADWLAMVTGRLSMQVGDTALAVGLLGAVVAALSGYTDFGETYGRERRIAFVHGIGMTAAVGLDLLSLALRWWGGIPLHGLAVLLATLALLMAAAVAYLGGHLTFALGTVVNHNAFTSGPTDFAAVGTVADFPEGELKRVDVAGMPILLTRGDGVLHAIGAVCSHAGGPLERGALQGDCVTCPWHGSRFSLVDGHVVDGPATFDQPLLDVRERGKQVEVRIARR